MPEIVLKAKVDEFLAHRVENLVKRGVFKNEEEFLKGAIKEMVRKYEIEEINKKMDNFAQKMAKRHPKSLSEAVLEARMEEDERL
jgi:Arc/MetJ-type ribon-helix-helix transcriptional regulator